MSSLDSSKPEKSPEELGRMMYDFCMPRIVGNVQKIESDRAISLLIEYKGKGFSDFKRLYDNATGQGSVEIAGDNVPSPDRIFSAAINKAAQENNIEAFLGLVVVGMKSEINLGIAIDPQQVMAVGNSLLEQAATDNSSRNEPLEHLSNMLLCLNRSQFPLGSVVSLVREVAEFTAKLPGFELRKPFVAAMQKGTGSNLGIAL